MAVPGSFFSEFCCYHVEYTDCEVGMESDCAEKEGGGFNVLENGLEVGAATEEVYKACNGGGKGSRRGKV